MRYSKKQNPSVQTEQEAIQIAKGIQRPGQTKEQTQLISQGIQKGIEIYKKQQKAKARELDKQRKSAKTRQDSATQIVTQQQVLYRQHRLPWILLIATWLAVVVYLLVQSN